MFYLKLYSLITEHGIQEFVVNLSMLNKTNEKQLWWQMYWPKEPYDPNRKEHEMKYAFKIE